MGMVLCAVCRSRGSLCWFVHTQHDAHSERTSPRALACLLARVMMVFRRGVWRVAMRRVYGLSVLCIVLWYKHGYSTWLARYASGGDGGRNGSDTLLVVRVVVTSTRRRRRRRRQRCQNRRRRRRI